MAKQFEKIEKTGKADVVASIDNSDAPWRVPTEHNWEYKRLGEVCTIKSGYTPSSDKLSSKGAFPYFKVAEMNLLGNETYLTNTQLFLSGEVRTFPKNSIVFPKNGAAVATNKKRILRFESVVDLNTAVMIANQEVLAEFLYKFMLNIDFALLIKRGTIPTLNITELKNLQIPVPAREVQERIVAELDKINEVIEDCRELVRNLDDLAQSLFYNFFGDPVTNPKGWVVKKFSEVFKLSSGDGLSAKQIEPGPFPVYGGNGIVGYHATSNLGGNNIIIGRVGALCGNVRLVKGDIFVTDNAFITTFKEILNDKFAEYLLTLLDLRQYAKAAAQPVISNSSLKNIQIPLPPLQLQQEFAKRIELIEFQKKAVEETIANLKTLLDSRMDYWFN